METELKLAIAPAATERLGRHPLLDLEREGALERLVATYYDTPERELRRRGASLRVRREHGAWVQTVKWSGQTRGGLHQRHELECELAGPEPDLARIAHPELDAIFRSEALAATIVPVFETDFTRAKRLLEVNGAMIEASLDRGEVRGGGGAEPVSELELELKGGAASALFDLALRLATDLPLRLENRSKAERGYALADHTAAAPRKAQLPTLEASMSTSEAFAEIAWSALTHLQANERGVLAGRDPEYLHQMRVALRRLRSALSTFAPVLPTAARAPIAHDLKRLNAALGAARDWDVLVTETLPAVRQAFAGRVAVETLIAQAGRLRAAAQRDMRRTVRTREFQRALLGLAAWLSARGWEAQADASGRESLAQGARAYAQLALERRYARVRKRGRRLEELTDDELHALRIAIKKLRYSIDFFGSLFDSGAVRRVRSRLARLQDVLGTINDAATLARLVDEGYAAGRAAGLSEARGILLGWSAGRADSLRTELARAWKSFRRCGTFW